MTGNPFVALYEDPVATLTAAAYVCVLLAALLATWYAAGRNALYLREQYRAGWLYLVPLWYCVRLVGMALVVALDLLLLAAIVHVLT